LRGPVFELDDEPDEIVPLTAEQARRVRAANPSISPWWVVLGQMVVGGLTVLAAWMLFGGLIAKSVFWGVLAVVLPAALFARGLTGQFARANPGAAVLSFFVWELVKILVTVGVLVDSAPSGGWIELAGHVGWVDHYHQGVLAGAGV
jgi:ATP synthase protein I